MSISPIPRDPDGTGSSVETTSTSMSTPTSSLRPPVMEPTSATTIAVFESLAALVYASGDVRSIMQAVTEAAVDLIPGCDHATIAMLVKGQFTTAAASDDIARQVDGLEREVGDGPCVDAIIGESYQADSDIREQCQWPQLAEKVIAQTPVRGMVGYRLVVDGQKQGALNVFSDTPGALTDESADVGAVLAAFASMALTAALQQQRADQLQAGLASNREIGKAIGLLMATHRIDADAAFQLLRSTSSRLNIKLAQVASRVVDQAATG
ncbi:MAG TPA: GAF and ANTAR domain-containing protein [Actinomycetales bacterium]